MYGMQQRLGSSSRYNDNPAVPHNISYGFQQTHPLYFEKRNERVMLDGRDTYAER